jgi:hypothetical protein
MAESNVNFRITNKDQNLYVNGERIVGAQSVSINKNFGIGDLGYAGIGFKAVNYIPKGAQSTTVNIDAYLFNQDYFLSYVTGTQTVNSFILRNSSDMDPPYSMLNGYFNSYTCEYSVGQIPRVSTSINVLGNAGKIPTGSLGAAALAELQVINTIYDGDSSNDDWGAILDGVTDSEDWLYLTGIITAYEDWNSDTVSGLNAITGLLIPYGGSISLNLDTFQTNRVQSFQINVQSQKVPIYNMGSRAPQRVDIVYPIDVNCQFTFDVGNYESVQTYDLPETPMVENLTAIINDYKTDENIVTYNFNNLNLLSETYGMSADGNATVTVVYNTKLYGQ